MNNVLLFHVGVPKTGTTAIQIFLHNNMLKLEKYGWCYPDLKAELDIQAFPDFLRERNGSLFREYINMLSIQTEDSAVGKLKKVLDDLWENIIEHLRTENVIISDEAFWDLYPLEFWKYVKSKYNNVKVIVYLRRQDLLVESRWNQRVKFHNFLNRTFQEFIGNDIRKEISFWSYKSRLDEISQIIGRENLIVRVYEKEQLQDNRIEKDFLEAIGIETNLEDWKLFDFQNLKLCGNYIEIKRMFNSILATKNYNVGRYVCDVIMKLSQAFAGEHVKEGYFTSTERKKFLQQFAEDNEQIAREYLNREDGILFYDQRMDYPLYETPQYSLFERDLANVFITMICDQQEELQKIKNQTYHLAGKLLMQNTNFREPVLFGAGYRCAELLENIKLPVSLIVDNNEKKCGEKIKGIEISYAKSIKDWSKYFVIVTCMETDEIEQQLLDLGLKKEEDYVLAKEYIY